MVGVWKLFFTISRFNSYLSLLILIAYSLNCVPNLFFKKQNRFKHFYINLGKKSVAGLISELLRFCALMTFLPYKISWTGLASLREPVRTRETWSSGTVLALA